MTYDVVIVGGGSAGCVLANRLSADEGRSVLLLEAGPDYRSTAELPADIASSAYAPQTHDWGYMAEPDAGGHEVAIPRGKIIGGSSSTNYCFAMRGRPADHDGWAELGNTGWSYDELLPFYKRMESYPHGEDDSHGRDGPLRLSRYDWDELVPVAAACVEACEALGYDRVEDFNAHDEIGVGLAPLSAVDGVRQSTALAYLNPVRDRPNLEVRGDAEVDKVLFDGRRAVGVRLASGEQIEAGHVVLCGGTYNSPTVLMRSGVGPADHLNELGIDVVADRPGVGQNLTEHPVMWNIYAAKPPEDEEVAAMFQAALSAKSGPEEPDYDLHVLPTAAVPSDLVPSAFVPPTENHPTGWDFIMFVSCVQPKSRGSVRLRSAAPSDAPVIDLGLYTHPHDAEKVAQAVRIARELAATPPLSDLLVGERAPGPDVDDAGLPEAVRNAPSHYNHAVGTCRMGPDSDPEAVVSPRCAVYGVENLSVVDASVMPTTVRVPTNPATIVVAERASVWLGADPEDGEFAEEGRKQVLRETRGAALRDGGAV